MFGFLSKIRAKRNVRNDLRETMVISYDAMKAAIDLDDPNQKSHEMQSRLISLSLALRDVYPNFPQEKDSLFTRYIAADLNHHPDLEDYQDAIEQHIRACPNVPAAKFEFMTYLIAPNFMKDFTQSR